MTNCTSDVFVEKFDKLNTAGDLKFQVKQVDFPTVRRCELEISQIHHHGSFNRPALQCKL